MFFSAFMSKPSPLRVSRQTSTARSFDVGRLERRETAHVADVVRARDLVALGPDQLLEPALAQAREHAVGLGARPAEHVCEPTERDALLLLVPRHGIGLAGELGVELLTRAEDLQPVVVEGRGGIAVDLARAPRGPRTPVRTASRACALRSGISSPRKVTRAARISFSSASSRSASSLVIRPLSHVFRSRYSRSRSSSDASASARRSASSCARVKRSA